MQVFVRFDSEGACAKAKEAMNGRAFESNTVTAKFISDSLWQRVKGGEWVDHKFVIDNPTGVQPASQHKPICHRVQSCSVVPQHCVLCSCLAIAWVEVCCLQHGAAQLCSNWS